MAMRTMTTKSAAKNVAASRPKAVGRSALRVQAIAEITRPSSQESLSLKTSYASPNVSTPFDNYKFANIREAEVSGVADRSVIIMVSVMAAFPRLRVAVRGPSGVNEGCWLRL
jgi:hypothetical protein